MQATINKDVIVVIGRGSATLPDDYPRDVGMERLRWDGENIVDLATLTAFWVEHRSGVFILHCKEFEDTVYVEMTYAQRRLLYRDDDGLIKVKTPGEVDADILAKKISAIKNLLTNNLQNAGNIAELLMVIVGLLAVIAIYARTGNTQAGAYLTSIIPKLQDLPLSRIQPLVPGAADTMKTVFDTYFNKLDELSGT